MSEEDDNGMSESDVSLTGSSSPPSSPPEEEEEEEGKDDDEDEENDEREHEEEENSDSECEGSTGSNLTPRKQKEFLTALRWDMHFDLTSVVAVSVETHPDLPELVTALRFSLPFCTVTRTDSQANPIDYTVCLTREKGVTITVKCSCPVKHDKRFMLGPRVRSWLTDKYWGEEVCLPIVNQYLCQVMAQSSQKIKTWLEFEGREPTNKALDHIFRDLYVVIPEERPPTGQVMLVTPLLHAWKAWNGKRCETRTMELHHRSSTRTTTSRSSAVLPSSSRPTSPPESPVVQLLWWLLWWFLQECAHPQEPWSFLEKFAADDAEFKSRSRYKKRDRHHFFIRKENFAKHVGLDSTVGLDTHIMTLFRLKDLNLTKNKKTPGGGDRDPPPISHASLGGETRNYYRISEKTQVRQHLVTIHQLQPPQLMSEQRQQPPTDNWEA